MRGRPSVNPAFLHLLNLLYVLNLLGLLPQKKTREHLAMFTGYLFTNPSLYHPDSEIGVVILTTPFRGFFTTYLLSSMLGSIVEMVQVICLRVCSLRLQRAPASDDTRGVCPTKSSTMEPLLQASPFDVASSHLHSRSSSVRHSAQGRHPSSRRSMSTRSLFLE